MINDDQGFGLDNLPYCVFSAGDAPSRCGVRIGDSVLPLSAVVDDAWAEAPSLNGFMAQGRARWAEVRSRVAELIGADRHLAAAYPLGDVRLHLPFVVGDYVDFYASEHHASNVGRIFRPGAAPLTPNWKHMPIGYHGRSGTVVVSGTPVRRPNGQRKAPSETEPAYGPSRRMDFEAEVGFVIGTGSELGTPVSVSDFGEHVFGVFLVNDWSSRDLQSWEYVPLGPFLGKSFGTSVSPWIVPLDALSAAWTEPAAQHPPVLPYLADSGKSGLDLALEVRINGQLVSSPPFAGMYWTPAQMLAHMTVNGASVRTGDFYASGTVSGAEPGQRGCLLELSWGGETPVVMPDGSERTFLEDGDEVSIAASAPAAGGGRLSFGEVAGRVVALQHLAEFFAV